MHSFVKISPLVILMFFFSGTLIGTGRAGSERTEYNRGLARTGQISCYDGQGNAVDFAGSGQDGEYQRGKVWPVPRFIHNGDGTISDTLTGLMWLKDGNCFAEVSWHLAKQKVTSLNQKDEAPVCHDYSASYTDWQLPELEELASLVDSEEAVAANFLKLSGFTNVLAQNYWTNTTYLNPLNAWSVDMAAGRVAFQNKIDKNLVLPVRHISIAKDEAEKSSVAGAEKQTEENKAQEEIEAEPLSRFVDNGDGTVSDTETGLMWLKDAGCFKERNWSDVIEAVAGFAGRTAADQCNGYKASYNDWTLPNRTELRSIVDYGHDFPALAEHHPFINLSPSYWTSTTSAAAPEHAFSVQMYYGSVQTVPKEEKLSGWPVRQIVPQVGGKRETTRSGLGDEVEQKFVVRIDPELQTEVHWPPSLRFFDNGDGTSMDSLTGYSWLTDANCFGKLSWKETFTTIQHFNADPRKFSCKGYEVSFGDWLVPSIEELKEITNAKEKNSATWLKKQGILNIQASGDYWSATPTMINLYYAYVLNFKNNSIHNYPQSLKFFFWPRRALPEDPERQPLINMTVNATGERVSLSTPEPFSIAVYLHTFGITDPADFWFWYETPDGKPIWLSPIRTWRANMTPVYQGKLFNLKDYEIMRGNTADLAPGDYVFYFAVDFKQDGVLDEERHQSRVIFSVD